MRENKNGFFAHSLQISASQLPPSATRSLGQKEQEHTELPMGGRPFLKGEEGSVALNLCTEDTLLTPLSLEGGSAVRVHLLEWNRHDPGQATSQHVLVETFKCFLADALR